MFYKEIRPCIRKSSRAFLFSNSRLLILRMKCSMVLPVIIDDEKILVSLSLFFFTLCLYKPVGCNLEHDNYFVLSRTTV